MDGDIAEGNDVRPLDLWMLFGEASGQARGGLADHDELLQNGALDQLILHEGRFVGPLKESLNGIAGV
jgi:hypothetical protein